MSASIQLKRHCKPLLQTVQGQQRVTRRGAAAAAAAATAAPTSPATPPADITSLEKSDYDDDENITRSPQTSSDDDADEPDEGFPAKRLGSAHYQSQVQMDSARSVDAQMRQMHSRKRKTRGFEASPRRDETPASLTNRPSGKVSPIDDGDEQLFADWHSSQSSRPTTYRRTLKTVNIHVPAASSKKVSPFTSFIDIPSLSEQTSMSTSASKHAPAKRSKTFIAPPTLPSGATSSTFPSSSYTTFKDPTTAPDATPAPDSPTSSPLSSPPPESPPTPAEIHCPMCNSPAPRSLWPAHARLTLREQRAFCLAHRRATALRQYAERGYPTIQWTQLGGRVSKFHTRLHDVACRRRPSRYRDALDERERTSGSRNDFRGGAVDASGAHVHTPGYYGLRGARALLDHVTALFKAAVPPALAADRLFAFAGFSGYLQAVLVPELALWLVMEDLGVTEAQAVAVVAESEGIGELVNGEDEESD